MYDVIISGGGPAGSKCAEIVAKAGYKVALIEKDITYRKPCGGGLPRAALFKFYPQLKKEGFHEINGTALFSDDYHSVKHVFENLDINPITVDRLKFDNIIRNIAIDAGTELFDKHISVDFIRKQGKKIGVRTKTSEGYKDFFGKIIIVADGMSSKLAPKSGLREKWKIEDLGLGRAAILEGKYSLEKNLAYFFFKKYGYCWIFPLSETTFNIGSITYFENNLKYNVQSLFKEFLVDAQNRGFLTETSYKEIWSGSYPEPAIGILDKTLCGDNVILIGDAGGFVAPINGEGVHGAIVSGEIAAKTSINALKKNDFTYNTLKAFRKDPSIKKLIRIFKLQRGFVDFFYENEGENVNKLFKLAEEEEKYNLDVINTLILGRTPPKDFFTRIKNI